MHEGKRRLECMPESSHEGELVAVVVIAVVIAVSVISLIPRGNFELLWERKKYFWCYIGHKNVLKWFMFNHELLGPSKNYGRSLSLKSVIVPGTTTGFSSNLGI